MKYEYEYEYEYIHTYTTVILFKLRVLQMIDYLFGKAFGTQR